ncbi:response regulator [bacterium]|nr:response regulator [bacterium]
MSSAEHTVLFVDDERNILSTLRRLCRREPFEAITAASGPEALDILRERPACVIISDFRMPGMTGVEMLAHAKDIVPDSVRIILSGYADTQSVVEAINKGEVYRFLAKPWDDQELLTVIRQSIEHWELKRTNAALEEQLKRQNQELQRLNENLEAIVTERTRSLVFAQEVLENLPLGVIGVSREGEVMVTNSFVSARFPDLGPIPPGEDVGDVLPGELMHLVQASIAGAGDGVYECDIGGVQVHLTIAHLGRKENDRGYLVVLRPREEVCA